MIKLNITVFFLLLCLINNSYAQNSVNAGGNDASGGDGSISYSIGELVYTPISSSSGNILQGIQQPFEIFSLNIPTILPDNFIKVFPIPTTQSITLFIEDTNNTDYAFEILDLQGKLLGYGSLPHQQTTVDMHKYPSGTYILRVKEKHGINFQSFKIIKQ